MDRSVNALTLAYYKETFLNCFQLVKDNNFTFLEVKKKLPLLSLLEAENLIFIFFFLCESFSFFFMEHVFPFP